MDAIGCQNHIADFTGSDAYLNNHDLGNASKIKDEFKMAGNTHFNAGDFEAAIKSYSNGLAIISPGLDDSTHTDISLLANRSAAYLNIGNYLASMADANTVLTRNPFHKKAIFRKSKCLFGLARYEEAVEFLQLKQKAMTSTEVFSLLENAKMYYRQQKFGEYRMSEMIQTKNCSRLNLADFIGQVEIVNNLSEEKGRSLIATENISAGDLLIACKAFDIVFPESDLEIDKIIQLKSSFCGKYLNSPGEMKLVESIQKLLTRERDPEKVKEFYKLYAGPELGYLPGDSLPAQIADLKRIEGICTFNGFAHGETIQSQFGLFENWGLWILPSYINHSCVDCNCTWRICGDFMFVRAFKSIRKGEEILISYLSPDGTYEKRKSIMDKHKFVCGCRLCQYENSMSDLERKRRKTLLKRIEIQVKLPFPNMDVDTLREIINELEKGETELNFCLVIGYRKLAEWHYGNFQYFKSAEVLEKAHKVVDGTVICRTAVHIAVNIVSSYLKAGNQKKAKEWVNILKENVRIAYGTPVKDILFKVAPHTAQEIQLYGIEM